MGILIAVEGTPNTMCDHTLIAFAPKVFAEGKLVGVDADSSGGTVTASQFTVKAGGVDILLNGDEVASHGLNLHLPLQNLTTPPQYTVFIGE
tara:strand:- start:451 stop:726 length:276 start_codon:yes stop_codon:yes gene_type:complete